MNQEHYVHVAVGVLLNEKKEVLVALRAATAHQGGLWEFPGGKVERNESVKQALGRELEEELGIRVNGCTPLTQVRHDYGDKSVLLDVWNISSFSGNPIGKEGQEIGWRKISELRPTDFPKANERIIRALSLPHRIAITPRAQDIDELREIIRHLLEIDAELICFRQKSLDVATHLDWFEWAETQCRSKNVGLMYCPPDDTIAHTTLPRLRALHVNSKQLRALNSRPTSGNRLFSASCHNLEELRLAEKLDADFAFLSPVRRTENCQDSQLLGWPGFQLLARQVNLPVFALGGVKQDDLAICQLHQGFGIAGISAFRRP